jgi:hypothetical protein
VSVCACARACLCRINQENWAKDIACVRKTESTWKISVGKVKRSERFRLVGIRWSDHVKWVFKK